MRFALVFRQQGADDRSRESEVAAAAVPERAPRGPRARGPRSRTDRRAARPLLPDHSPRARLRGRLRPAARTRLGSRPRAARPGPRPRRSRQSWRAAACACGSREAEGELGRVRVGGIEAAGAVVVRGAVEASASRPPARRDRRAAPGHPLGAVEPLEVRIAVHPAELPDPNPVDSAGDQRGVTTRHAALPYGASTGSRSGSTSARLASLGLRSARLGLTLALGHRLCRRRLLDRLHDDRPRRSRETHPRLRPLRRARRRARVCCARRLRNSRAASEMPVRVRQVSATGPGPLAARRNGRTRSAPISR